MSNRDKIEEKLKERETETEDSAFKDFLKRYGLLLIYCAVVLLYYVIRYVILPAL